MRMITHFYVSFYLSLKHEHKIMQKDDETRLRCTLIIVCFSFNNNQGTLIQNQSERFGVSCVMATKLKFPEDMSTKFRIVQL